MFGKVIADRRAERNMDVATFCDKCGCTRQTLWNWEHNESTPLDPAKKKICEILDLPITIFFDDESK